MPSFLSPSFRGKFFLPGALEKLSLLVSFNIIPHTGGLPAQHMAAKAP